MIRTSLSHAALALMLVLTLPAVAVAQEVVQPLPGTTDADRLGDEMRRIGANPQDVDALLSAGELSLKLSDLSGAASLFARAEKVDPRNGRLKAGMAAILVRSERPGEALRYFDQAQALGYDPGRFAADRGLAYDLIGEQARAQHEYRLALKDMPGDDETVRRYALSLGISGQQKDALEQLDPLLRKTDRGAWRARAFVLAMGGNLSEASNIARTMMPAGMASGLQPFFERLPTLPVIDRAFAVHFGEVRPTPERLADARLVPALPAFTPDPVAAPVALAAVQQPVESTRDRRNRERRERRAAKTAPKVQMAAGATQPAQVPVTVAPAPPGYRPPIQVAALTARPMPQPLPQSVGTQPFGRSSAPLPPSPVVQQPMVMIQPLPARSDERVPAVAGQPQRPLGMVPPSVVTPLPSTASAGVVAAAMTSTTPSVVPVPSREAVQQMPTVAATAAGSPAVSPAPVAVAAVPPAAIRRSGDMILARIVAALSIPASELGVVEPERTAPVRSIAGSAEHVVAVADAKEARDAAAQAVVEKRVLRDARGRRIRDAPVDGADETVAMTPAQKRAGARKDAAAAKADKLVADAEPAPLTPAEQRAATRKATADKKALAAKKAAADAKMVADKEAAEEKKLARANPARIWVQVAGGATESDLPKAYKAVKAKAPDTFGSRSGWTVPLRATNRVLAGPFKTDAEARAFVNQLKKDGVSAFTFTSEAGQVVARLPAR